MSDPDKPQKDFGLHPGDLGVVAIAIVCLIAFLGLMFGPSPLKGIEKFDAVADKIKADIIAKNDKKIRQQEIDAAVASGVVDVTLAKPKKH